MYRHGGQPRPEAANLQAEIETGDRPNARLGQGGGQCAEVVRPDHYVAVGQNNERMANLGRHIDEVGDLAVGAMDGGVHDKLKIDLGVFSHQRFDHRNDTVVRILYAEYDL